ncbi:MAG TPA: hypothetical protein VIY08_12600 [Candidatus Nitrosocosmicus sp.]
MTSKPSKISPRLTRLVIRGPFHRICWLMLSRCIYNDGIMQQSNLQIFRASTLGFKDKNMYVKYLFQIITK